MSNDHTNSSHILLGKKLVTSSHLSGTILHGINSPLRINTFSSQPSSPASHSPAAQSSLAAMVLKHRTNEAHSSAKHAHTSSTLEGREAVPSQRVNEGSLPEGQETRFWGGLRPTSSASALRPTKAASKEQRPSTAMTSSLWSGYDLNPETREKLELIWKSAKEGIKDKESTATLARASSAHPALATGRNISHLARSSASSDDNGSEEEEGGPKQASSQGFLDKHTGPAKALSHNSSDSPRQRLFAAGKPPLPPVTKSTSSLGNILVPKSSNHQAKARVGSPLSTLSRSSSSPAIRYMHPAVISNPSLPSSTSASRSRLRKSSDEGDDDDNQIPLDHKGRFYPYVSAPLFPGACPTISFTGCAEEKHKNGLLPLERVAMMVRFAGIANGPVKNSFKAAGFKV